MRFLIAAVLPPSPADSDSGVSSDLESSSDDKLRLQGTNDKYIYISLGTKKTLLMGFLTI